MPGRLLHSAFRSGVQETRIDTPTDSEGWLKTAPAPPYAGQCDAKAPDAGYPGDGSAAAAMSAPRIRPPESRAESAACPPPPDARRHRGSTPPPGSVFRRAPHGNNESADLPCKAGSGGSQALPIKDTTASNSVQPLFTTDGAEVFAQAIEYGLPRPRRQIERAGLVVCGRKR